MNIQSLIEPPTRAKARAETRTTATATTPVTPGNNIKPTTEQQRMTLMCETLYIRFPRYTAGEANALDDNATLAYATKSRLLSSSLYYFTL